MFRSQLRQLSVAGNFTLWTVGGALLLLLYLLLDLASHPTDISPYLAMRLSACNLLLADCRPYVDFWDGSLPAVYDLFFWPCRLRLFMEKCGCYLPLNTFVLYFVWFLTATSTFTIVLLLDRAFRNLQKLPLDLLPAVENELKLAALPFALSLPLAALICRFDLGDLQNLLCLALFPWILLRWLVVQGFRPPLLLSILIGISAASAASLDLPHLVFFILLELYFVWRQGSLKILLRPEMAAFAITFIFSVGRIFLLEKSCLEAFCRWTIPFRLLNYSVFEETLFAPLTTPDRRDIFYVLAGAIVAGFTLDKKCSLMAPLLLIALAGFALYILEGEGYSRHLVVTVFACTVVIAILVHALLADFLKKLLPAPELHIVAGLRLPSLVAAVLIVALLFGASLNRDRDRLKSLQADQGKGNLEDALTAIDKYSRRQDRVLVVSDNPAIAYPALLLLDRRPGGYLLWGRPLRIFQWCKDHDRLNGSIKDFYDYTYQKLREDLTAPDLRLLLVHNYLSADILKKEGLDKIYASFDSPADCINYSVDNRQPREYSGLNWNLKIFKRP